MTHWLPVFMVILAVTLFVALCVAWVAVSRAQDRRYRSGLLDWATARGWTYRGGRGGEWNSLLPKGDGQRGVKIRLDGTRRGRAVLVAHYWYQTTGTSTDHRSSMDYHALTVIAVGWGPATRW